MAYNTVVYFFAFAVSLVLVFYFWGRRKLYFLAWSLPGPFSYPFFGNGLYFFCHPNDILRRVVKLSKKYPSPMRIWLGPKLVILVKDPNQLQTVMQSSKYTEKSFVYDFLEPFMGKGLFTSSGLQHRTQRKLLQPLFCPKFVEGYSHLFQKHANKLVRLLKYKVNKDKFDVLHVLHESAFEATMDIILEDKNDHSYDYKDMPTYVRRFYHIFSQRVMNFWLHWNIFFKNTKYFKEQEYMTKIASTLTEEITKDRIPEIQKRLISENFNVKEKEARVPSMLESMLKMVYENPDCLNENQFRDHMMTFVATSQDTQSSAVAFTLMMLGIYPDIQEKVLLEINEALNGKDILNYEDISKLSYMEMCIKEAMRLFPLGPFLPRDTVEEFQLDKWTIPKGCSILLEIYNVHRNPVLWDKPEEFYPEHFSCSSVSQRHPFAFLPFSGGPRRCIAQQYSYVNMKIIITTILRNFKLSCDGNLKNLKLMTDVSIRPIDGYMISIQERIF